VSISGAFSSGKTTLAETILSQRQNVGFVPEVATYARVTIPGFNWATSDGRAYMFWQQVVWETEALKSHKTVIVDTGIIEVIAHQIEFGLSVPNFWYRYAEGRYGLAFICDPSDVAIVDNGIRCTDPVLRHRLHLRIRDLVENFAKEVYVVSGSLEDRSRVAVAKLDRVLLNG